MITKIKTKAKAMSTFKKIVAIVLVLAVLSTITAFAAENAGYYVELDDGDSKTTVYTTNTSPREIVREAGIELSALDTLDLDGFIAGEDSTIRIERPCLVGVNDERGTVYFTFEGTVAQAISEAKVTVGENDLVNYEKAATVSDGMIISVAHAFPVAVRAYGKHINLEMAVGTVSDALKKVGITLGENDVVSHDLSEVVSSGMVIFVDEVIYEEKTETKSIPFDKTTKKSDHFAIGTTKITTKGVNGEKEVCYKEKYVNGKLVDSVVLSEKVTKKPGGPAE